jgi:hypothetical protein
MEAGYSLDKSQQLLVQAIAQGVASSSSCEPHVRIQLVCAWYAASTFSYHENPDMDIDAQPLQTTPIAGAADNHDMPRASSPAQPDAAAQQTMEKIATSIEHLRLEMQGIRLALEALVAKP